MVSLPFQSAMSTTVTQRSIRNVVRGPTRLLKDRVELAIYKTLSRYWPLVDEGPVY